MSLSGRFPWQFREVSAQHSDVTLWPGVTSVQTSLNPARLSILLCLTPDNFRRNGEPLGVNGLTSPKLCPLHKPIGRFHVIFVPRPKLLRLKNNINFVFCLTNKEALTVLCSVVKHAGSG